MSGRRNYPARSRTETTTSRSDCRHSTESEHQHPQLSVTSPTLTVCNAPPAESQQGSVDCVQIRGKFQSDMIAAALRTESASLGFAESLTRKRHENAGKKQQQHGHQYRGETAKRIASNSRKDGTAASQSIRVTRTPSSFICRVSP